MRQYRWICDRCKFVQEDSRDIGCVPPKWEYITQVGMLCPKCFAELKKWLSN